MILSILPRLLSQHSPQIQRGLHAIPLGLIRRVNCVHLVFHALVLIRLSSPFSRLARQIGFQFLLPILLGATFHPRLFLCPLSALGFPTCEGCA
ncbi:MAG: hypothetical protein IT310_01795 [Anaerolineales bacterium]|nr:hypothetical protein [Anaerolineales bacterium]